MTAVSNQADHHQKLAREINLIYRKPTIRDPRRYDLVLVRRKIYILGWWHLVARKYPPIDAGCELVAAPVNNSIGGHIRCQGTYFSASLGRVSRHVNREEHWLLIDSGSF